MSHHLRVRFFVVSRKSHSQVSAAQVRTRSMAGDVSKSTVDLITGVGEALRMVHMSVLPATRIETTRGKLTLGDLKPGDVVEAECRVTDKGLVADKIEKLTPEGQRGAAAPWRSITRRGAPR